MRKESALRSWSGAFVRRPAVLVMLVIATAFLVTPPAAPERAVARKGYGGYRNRIKKACRKDCGKRRRTCLFCTKQDRKQGKAECKLIKGEGAACTDGGCAQEVKARFQACKQALKSRFRSAKGECKGRIPVCKGCCNDGGGYGECQKAFSGTKGYPQTFRRVCSGYGGQRRCRRYTPDCGPRCGNGIVEPGEDCDDPGVAPRGTAETCTRRCTVPSCGDGIRSGTEQCDDGNTTPGDGCEPNCTFTLSGIPPSSSVTGALVDPIASQL